MFQCPHSSTREGMSSARSASLLVIWNQFYMQVDGFTHITARIFTHKRIRIITCSFLPKLDHVILFLLWCCLFVMLCFVMLRCDALFVMLCLCDAFVYVLLLCRRQNLGSACRQQTTTSTQHTAAPSTTSTSPPTATSTPPAPPSHRQQQQQQQQLPSQQ